MVVTAQASGNEHAKAASAFRQVTKNAKSALAVKGAQSFVFSANLAIALGRVS